MTEAELSEIWWRTNEVGYPFGAIIKLLILTGLRRGEAAALRWSWIDPDDGLIVLPSNFTKNRREHRLPIGSLAHEVIDKLRRTSDLLFLARGKADRCFNGWGKAKERFDKSLEIAPYRLHDFRRTFSSNLAQLGTPMHVTEKLLNHVSGTVSGVAAIYNRYSYLDEMRAAISTYETHLAKVIDPE